VILQKQKLSMSKQNKNQQHIPVMLKEVLETLNPQDGESYLDLTAGYGGHAAKIINRTHSPQKTVLIDRDLSAVKALKSQFSGSEVNIIRTDFYSASQKLTVENRRFDLILADLGVSSPHLESASRGFSITHHGRLDMRMDRDQAYTAEQLVNTLRIAVNDELNQLSRSLPYWEELLSEGGRLAVISFHSLEDRIVKRFFQERAGNTYDAELKLLSKKPITPNDHEIKINPRARSAKLRAVAKIKIIRKE
jgi:16S rRNA C1402 N4-methylase RsmH